MAHAPGSKRMDAQHMPMGVRDRTVAGDDGENLIKQVLPAAALGDTDGTRADAPGNGGDVGASCFSQLARQMANTHRAAWTGRSDGRWCSSNAA